MSSTPSWSRVFLGCHVVTEVLEQGPRDITLLRTRLDNMGFSTKEISKVFEFLPRRSIVVVNKEDGAYIWRLKGTGFDLR